MPAAGPWLTTREIDRIIVYISLSSPIARIARIGIAPVPIIGRRHITDKIVTGRCDNPGHHPPSQIGMVGESGINIRHYHAQRTSANGPGRRGIDPAGRVVHIPLITSSIVWVVRGEGWEDTLVRNSIFHFRQAHELIGNLLYLVQGERCRQFENMRVTRHAAQVGQGES